MVLPEYGIQLKYKISPKTFFRGPYLRGRQDSETTVPTNTDGTFRNTECAQYTAIWQNPNENPKLSTLH